MTKHICFVGSDVYPVLNPNFGPAYIGGESVQHTLLARAFSDKGWRVSLVDQDYGQPEGESIGGITVHKTYPAKAGIPIIRFVYPRLTGILKALKKADADIYYQSCAGAKTGFVAWFCKKYKRKFVFRTAHDTDCIPGEHLINLWRDKQIYTYGLKRADLIAVQGVNQARLLQKYYGMKGFVVNMAVELPLDQELTASITIDGLWVNNFRPFKRPERFIELAKSLPEYRFVMIGGACAGLESYYETIANLAKPVKNLEFLGPVPYHQVNRYFSDAKVFINTSESEGFPNSFLQAWIRSVPVISFFDPDSLIDRNRLGSSPNKMEDMIDEVKNILNDTPLRMELSHNAKKFALKHYAPSAVVNSYIELFEKRILT
jgi:glycosyltransferase involved in cell wall biosynthesis